MGLMMYELLTGMVSLYANGNAWMEAQVAIDNIAIETAKEDITIFEYLRERNRQLEIMEFQHHALHACAHSPTGPIATSCKPQDVAAEQFIANYVRETEIIANSRWLANGARALRNLSQVSLRYHFSRYSNLPVALDTCWCGVKNQFALVQDEIGYRFSAKILTQQEVAVSVKLVGKSLTQKSKWKYQLGTGDDDEG